MSTLKRRIVKLESKKPQNDALMVFIHGEETAEQKAQIEEAEKSGRDVKRVVFYTIDTDSDDWEKMAAESQQELINSSRS